MRAARDVDEGMRSGFLQTRPCDPLASLMLRVGRSERGAVLEHDGDALPVCFVLVVEVVVEVEQPVLDRDASLAGLVGEVEVDRRAGPREPKLILDHRILPRVRVGLRAADVEIRRRGRDREREERRLGLSDRAVRGRAAAQVGLGQVVLQPQGAVSLAGGEPEHGRVLLRELDRTRGGERAQRSVRERAGDRLAGAEHDRRGG